MPGDWPGEEYRAEVQVRINRGWVGGPKVEIKQVNTSQGYTLSIGPLIMAKDYDLIVSAYRGDKLLDRKHVGVSVEWNSSKTIWVRWLGLGGEPHARIVAEVWHHGDLETQAEVTI